MKANSVFFWLFVIGGFVTAAVGVAYFASGEAGRGPESQSYMALLQIPLGVAVTLYGVRSIGDEKQR